MQYTSEVISTGIEGLEPDDTVTKNVECSTSSAEKNNLEPPPVSPRIFVG